MKNLPYITQYLKCLLLAIVAVLFCGGIAQAQSFDITCPGGTVNVTPMPSGAVRIVCAPFTPTPLPSATPSPTPTRTPTLVPPTATSTSVLPTATSTPLPPTATPVSSGPVVAFPGAEGWGAQSVGGRGGRVIEVTNLNDSGAGSLRACILATGARTCVFRVAGTITLATRLEITSPNITIAGQTAPGGGIALKNGANEQAPIGVFTNHVIIRHLRLRPGPPASPPASTGDGITIGGTSRYVILDHLSISWGYDELVNVWDTASDVTVQWSMLYNGLCEGWHGDDHIHCDSMLVGSDSTRVSIHHNLLAHNDMRNPRLTGGDIDFVNNVIYNAGTTPSRMDHLATSLAARLNFVNNYIKRGPSSHYTDIFKCGGAAPVGCYVAGNVASPTAQIASTDSSPYLVGTRYPFPQVATTSPAIAYADVLDRAGATKPARDSADIRVVNEVNQGTGVFINDPRLPPVGGWPTLASGTPYADSDHDGISNLWEVDHGLNPNDVADGAQVSPSGYTWLEVFLSELD